MYITWLSRKLNDWDITYPVIAKGVTSVGMKELSFPAFNKQEYEIYSKTPEQAFDIVREFAMKRGIEKITKPNGRNMMQEKTPAQ